MTEPEILPAREVAVREFNSLRGRLCSAIESAGLPPKQERNLILLIKSISYQNQAVVDELISKLDPNDEQQFVRVTQRLGQNVS